MPYNYNVQMSFFQLTYLIDKFTKSIWCLDHFLQKDVRHLFSSIIFYCVGQHQIMTNIFKLLYHSQMKLSPKYESLQSKKLSKKIKQFFCQIFRCWAFLDNLIHPCFADFQTSISRPTIIVMHNLLFDSRGN